MCPALATQRSTQLRPRLARLMHVLHAGRGAAVPGAARGRPGARGAGPAHTQLGAGHQAPQHGVRAAPAGGRPAAPVQASCLSPATPPPEPCPGPQAGAPTACPRTALLCGVARGITPPGRGPQSLALQVAERGLTGVLRAGWRRPSSAARRRWPSCASWRPQTAPRWATCCWCWAARRPPSSSCPRRRTTCAAACASGGPLPQAARGCTGMPVIRLQRALVSGTQAAHLRSCLALVPGLDFWLSMHVLACL